MSTLSMGLKTRGRKRIACQFLWFHCLVNSSWAPALKTAKVITNQTHNRGMGQSIRTYTQKIWAS